MKTLIAALNARFSHSSLALRCIQRYCAGYAVEAAEYTINDDIMSIYSDIYGRRPDLLGFSCYVWNIEPTLKLCRMLKSVLPGLRIMLGGPEAACRAAQMLAAESVDMIIIGEGEEPTRRLLEKGGNPVGVAGIMHREGFLPPPPPVEPPSPYAADDFAALIHKVVYYETSRGCPFACAYCLSSVQGSVRYFDLERVKADLLLFIRQGVQLVKLVDRTFNADPIRARALFAFLAEHGRGVIFHMEIAAHLLTDELLELLETAPAGMFRFEIGVQSVNAKTLAAINRACDLERLAQNARRLADGNIFLHMDLIAGLPFEDYAGFRRSFDFVYDLNPHMLQLGFLKVLPQTPMADRAEEYGIIYRSTPPYEVLETAWMSAAELIRLHSIEDAVERYYNSRAFTRALKLAVNGSAFDFFEQLSRRNEAHPSRRRLYDIFWEFCVDKGWADSDMRRALVFDLLLGDFSARLPVWANRAEPPRFKQKRAAFLASALRTLLPGREISEQAYRSVRIEPFDGRVYLLCSDGVTMDVTDYFHPEV